MIRHSIFCLILVIRCVFLEDIIGPDAFEWIIKDGEKKPVLKMVVHDETIELPLRQAPFCYLAEIRNCECFILHNGEDSSDWDVASLVKCGNKVRGDFMSTNRYYEIAPKEGGKPGEHIVENYIPSADESVYNSTEKLPKTSIQEHKEESKRNQNNTKYIKPLPEYGRLFENETGYITVKFIVAESLFKYESESSIDEYLQNLVNSVNQFIARLNLLIVYRGWMEALANENNLTKGAAIKFVTENRYLIYEKESIHDALILFGPVNDSLNEFCISDRMCYGNPAHFVRYVSERNFFRKRNQAQLLLCNLAKGYGIPSIDRKRCGEPPPQVVWIMDCFSYNVGRLKWAECSLEVLRRRRANLACLRKKIHTSRFSCGNGLVEDGEECDCVVDDCRGCCTKDCKLTANSTCSNGPCCDIRRCQFFDDRKQCRASEDFCDIPELCDGVSSKCPSNYVVANGYRCKGPFDEAGFCFNGVCGSRQDVCGYTFRDGKTAGDFCYDLNELDKTNYGGCGPTFQSSRDDGESYFACTSANKFCGKIFCTQPGIEDQMDYTDEYAPYFDYEAFYSGIKNLSCGYMGLKRYYRHLREDPTFVPNGSICGNMSMCVKQECVDLPRGCPDNCPGKRIVHPYTNEIFPAFILNEDSEQPSTTPIWPYFLAGFLMMVSIVLALYFIYCYDPEFLPKKWTFRQRLSQSIMHLRTSSSSGASSLTKLLRTMLLRNSNGSSDGKPS